MTRLLACCLPLVLLAAGAPAFAQETPTVEHAPPEWWVDVNVASHHFEDADEYLGPGGRFNQNNYGAGIEVQWQPRHAASAGYYRNSVYEDSWYALYHYTPIRLGAHVRLGGMAGLVSGYPGYNDGNPAPAAALVAKVEYRRVGMNLLYLPKVPGASPDTLGLQLKFRLGR